MHSIPCPWRAWDQGCPSVAGWTQLLSVPLPCWAHIPSKPRTPCITLCTDHQSQPSSCSLEGKMWGFSFPCTSPAGKRPCTSSWSLCGAGLLLACQGGTDISTFTHGWTVLVSQVISRCCTLALCSLIGTLHSQVPDVNRNHAKAPCVFSSRSLAKKCTLIAG